MKTQVHQALLMSMQPDDVVIQQARHVLEEAKGVQGFVQALLELIADSTVELSKEGLY